MKKVKVIISDRLWVPRENVKKKHVKPYEVRLFNEDKCIKCPNLPDRFNYVCESCEHYGGQIKTWKFNEAKTKVGFPVGAADTIIKDLEIKAAIVDKRTDTAIGKKLLFTGNLFKGETVNGVEKPNQVVIIKEWLAAVNNSIAQRGFIQARPRTGKTVMGTAITCHLGLTTLILAHNEELLQNFYKTFVGDKESKRPAMTNAKDVGVKVSIIKDDKDWKNVDVALCTYQKFISKYGAARLKKYAHKFGLVIVDEAHQSGADAYARVLINLRPKYLLALSATPERKDGRIILSFQVLGPVLAEGDVGALVPAIELFETGVTPKTAYKTWMGMIQFLCRNEDRNKKIVKQVFKDLRDGQKSILIPVDFKLHMKTLVTMINKQARINNKKRGESWPQKLATPFSADSGDRKWLLNKIRAGDHQVTVAIRSMVKQGIDVDAWDTLYMVMPINNNAMFYQLINRICNPLQGKKPIMRWFLDNIPASLGCFRATWFKTVIPGLRKRYNEKGEPISSLYRISKEDFERAMDIAKTRDYRPRETDKVKKEIAAKAKRSGLGKYA